MVIKGFEDAIEGMAVGEEKEVHLTKDEAYGDPNPELVKEIPKAALEGSNIELKVGIVLAFKVDQTGQVIPGKVMKNGDETITIDINPPLAGKNLNFKIKLVDVKDAPKEEPKQEPKCEPEEGDACGCGHEH